MAQVEIELKTAEGSTVDGESYLEIKSDIRGCSGSIVAIQQEDTSEIDNENLHPKTLFHCLYSQRGILCTLLSTVVFAVQGVVVSFLKDDLTSTEIVAIRLWLIFGITLPIVIARRIPIIATKKDMRFLILRSLLGTANLVLKYVAYQNMSVGDATAIFQATPAFTGIFARIFLKEPFRILEMSVVLLSAVGVVIVSQPAFLFPSNRSGVENSLKGIISALSTMILTSLIFVVMRAMGKQNIRPFQTVLYFTFIGGLLLSAFNMVSGIWTIPQCGMVRYSMVALGVIGFFGQALITYVFTVENAVIVSVLRTNEVIAAFLLEFLILGVAPSLFSGLGSALIIASSLLLSYKKILRNRSSTVSRNTRRNSFDEEDET